MDTNLLIAAIVAAVIIVFILMRRPKYYKEHTIYLFFQTKDSIHDRVIFFEKGLDDPGDLVEEITKKREEIEELTNSPAILKNIRIFKPTWKK